MARQDGAMAAIKGRAKRDRTGTAPLYAWITDETRARLEAGAGALGISLAAYLDLFVGHVQVDENKLPEWVRTRLEEEQLPLNISA
jgi:hypothetical protein